MSVFIRTTLVHIEVINECVAWGKEGGGRLHIMKSNSLIGVSVCLQHDPCAVRVYVGLCRRLDSAAWIQKSNSLIGVSVCLQNDPCAVRVYVGLCRRQDSAAWIQ